MSFGQGGPPWGGPGSPGQDPYGSQRGSQDPYGTQDPYGAPNSSRDPYAPDTPDWAALADASAARTRRRRWLLIGGGVLATAVVAAIVATAVVSMNGGGEDRASDKNTSEPAVAGSGTPSESAAPEPSFSSVAPLPAPSPKDFISSADKDKAPLSADTLFPGRKLTMGDRVYEKGATSSTTNCAAATQGSLGSVLASNSCDRVIRATYAKDGVAVTIGVAVFGEEAQALKAKNEVNQRESGIASLSGAGVTTFCRAPSVCRKTVNSYGRYVYFTVGGFTSGKDVTTADKDVFTTGDDIAEFTFRQIHRRGRLQASAAAAAPVGQ
ncbi:hypothetical protein [Streptomyces sp. AK02-01A]|uniref:hypothetical protein n=1 Tax=Streptomyces sp. AK02-01A TaxID=3028648 RepID=UPI0029A1CDAE|nr:hypothetical protein [Streptomyces sp. AK02-01A]MDX3851260.1 hypothetical protein [Streptomyces sp. AK02-01A]